MENLLLNEVFLSIYSKDGYYSLSYYSFNDEGLFFKDKFSDNSLNYENVVAFVRQLRPTFCVLNCSTKNELYYLLVSTLDELFITNRIDDCDDDEASSVVSTENKFTSIRNNVSLMNVDPIDRLISPNSLNNNRSDDQMTNLNSGRASSLQNDAISTTFDNKNSRILLLTNKFYNVDLCKKAIFECDYHQENIFTESDKRIFITSLINLADDFLLKSIGALLIYINQSKLNANNNAKGERCSLCPFF